MTYDNNQSTQLSMTFIPGQYDVICARGKIAKNHSGNKFYREIIKNVIPQYSEANTKIGKTIIVSAILDEIRTRSSSFDGRFIRKNSDGHYYEVSDHFAREKIGQSLRDSLSNRYKSSTKAKRRKRVAVRTKTFDDIDEIIKSNQFVNNRMNILTSTIEKNGVESTPEFFMNELFIKTNKEILEAFKNDAGLLYRFNKAEENYKTESSQ
jgi:hypothetical protein